MNTLHIYCRWWPFVLLNKQPKNHLKTQNFTLACFKKWHVAKEFIVWAVVCLSWHLKVYLSSLAHGYWIFNSDGLKFPVLLPASALLIPRRCQTCTLAFKWTAKSSRNQRYMSHCNWLQLLQGLQSVVASSDVPTSLSTFAFVDSGWSVICKIYNRQLWCWADVQCQHSAIQENTLSPLGYNVFFSLLTAYFDIKKQTSVPWVSLREENFKSVLIPSWNFIWYNIPNVTKPTG